MNMDSTKLSRKVLLCHPLSLASQPLFVANYRLITSGLISDKAPPPLHIRSILISK